MNIEKQYRESDRLNYSLLSDLAKDPRKAYYYLNREEDESSPSQALQDGTLLDKLAFSGEDIWDHYVIEDLTVPSEKLMPIAQQAIEHKSLDPDFILKVTRECGYQPKWTDDTVKKNVVRDIKEYVNAFFEADGKIIISTEKYARFKEAVDYLKTNQFTAPYFNLGIEDGYEVRFQVPIFWEEQSLKDPNVIHTFKGLRDILFIDHNKKTKTPVDLKRNSLPSFERVFYGEYKYYIQASMYYHGTMMSTDEDGLEDYNTERTIYVVSNTSDISRPRLYQPTTRDLMVGRSGGVFVANPTRRVKGYLELADELEWHIRNHEWDYTYEEVMNAGIQTLNALTPDGR